MKKKIFKFLAYFLIIVIFLLYFVYPVSFGFIATLKFKEDVNNKPDGFSDIKILTSDNVKLSAWYKAPRNGVSIIVVHGATTSRNEVIKHVNMLADDGFGVLAFDMRGHGESDGDGAVLYNWDGEKDVRAAVDYLLKQEDVKKIGALGLSLGAEVLLGSVYNASEIKAVVSEGATQRTMSDYLVLTKNQSLFRSYTPRLMYLSLKLFSGAKEPIRIIDSIKKAEDTHFLFIAAGKEEDEIEFNTYFYGLTKNRADLWIIRDVKHVQGISKKKYSEMVLQFFNVNLID